MSSLAPFFLSASEWLGHVQPTVAGGVCYLSGLAVLHMALLWLGGTRSMRFIALAGIVAAATAIGVALALDSLRDLVRGDAGTLRAAGTGHAILCFAWAATLAIYGLLRLAGAMALLGILVAWSGMNGNGHAFAAIGGPMLLSGLLAFTVAKLMTRRGEAFLERMEALARTRIARPSAHRPG